MKYVIKTLSEVREDEWCSCDDTYTVSSLAGMIAAHNTGALDIEEHVFFCHKEDYQFAPKTAPVLVRINNPATPAAQREKKQAK